MCFVTRSKQLILAIKKLSINVIEGGNECSDNYIEHINTMCGQSVDIFNVTAADI